MVKAQNSAKRPVLVVGWIPRIIVPIARSLHRNGVPVDVVDFNLQPRIHSRAIREFRRIPRPYLDPMQFVQQLQDLIRQGGHDMVVPTDDQALVALAEHYDEFKHLAHIACPPPEITARVLDKNSTLQIAQKCGIRVPRTKVISNSVQLLEFVGSLPFPWVLKPASKETRVEETKSYSFAAAHEVTAKFSTVQEFTPPLLLQEYCSGAGVGVEMLMHEGECRAVFQHRRLQEYPYTGGFSVTAVAERPDPVLVEQSLALLRALEWDGPAMVEFKVNPSDGSAVLMEVNGRYWGTISLPITAGIDFPLYHWQLRHGEVPAVPSQPAAGTKWRWTRGHIHLAHDLLLASRRSKSTRKALFRSLLRLPGAFGPSGHDSLFAFSDPLPAVLELYETFRYLLADDLRALYRRLSPPIKAADPLRSDP